MHGNGADRIVDADALHPEHSDDGDQARHEADHDCGPGRDEPRSCRDRDQRRENTVEHHRDVRLAKDQPGAEDSPDRSGGRCEVRRQRDVREVADLVAGDDRERRAGIEAEPPEPEDDRAENGVRHVVARNRVRAAVLAELADARTE